MIGCCRFALLNAPIRNAFHWAFARAPCRADQSWPYREKTCLRRGVPRRVSQSGGTWANHAHLPPQHVHELRKCRDAQDVEEAPPAGRPEPDELEPRPFAACAFVPDEGRCTTPPDLEVERGQTDDGTAQGETDGRNDEVEDPSNSAFSGDRFPPRYLNRLPLSPTVAKGCLARQPRQAVQKRHSRRKQRHALSAPPTPRRWRRYGVSSRDIWLKRSWKVRKGPRPRNFALRTGVSSSGRRCQHHRAGFSTSGGCGRT